MRVWCYLCVLLVASPVLAATPNPKEKPVILQGLNKVTARVSQLQGNLLQPIEFGKLSIVVKACQVSDEDERPEQAALLEIAESTHDGRGRIVFSGWMFASSPALSALEHPVYDITLIQCRS